MSKQLLCKVVRSTENIQAKLKILQPYEEVVESNSCLKPVFHWPNLFARGKSVTTAKFFFFLCFERTIKIVRIQKYSTGLQKPLMEQKHARAAQNIVRTHPSFSKMTCRLRNSPGNTTSFLTDGQTQIEISTIHSSAQKTGSSELWRILMTSRIVCNYR